MCWNLPCWLSCRLNFFNISNWESCIYFSNWPKNKTILVTWFRSYLLGKWKGVMQFLHNFWHTPNPVRELVPDSRFIAKWGLVTGQTLLTPVSEPGVLRCRWCFDAMLRRPSGGLLDLPATSSCQVQGPGSRIQGSGSPGSGGSGGWTGIQRHFSEHRAWYRYTLGNLNTMWSKKWKWWKGRSHRAVAESRDKIGF